MEKAIFITKLRDLDKATKDLEYSRLYFGNEFCERLIPSDSDFSEAFDFSRKQGLKFTVVTPYITDSGIEKIKKIIKQFDGENIEIVVNDWGLLNLLNDRNFSLNLGRLLVKRKKDPRILSNKFSKEMMHNLVYSNLGVKEFQNFLKENGIVRVELDNVFHGQPDISKSKLVASLYYPYVYLTTTRKCLMNKCDTISGKDDFFISACNKECQNYHAVLKNKDIGKDILLKGNTQFIKNDILSPKLKEKGIDRLVFQPTLPL